jgi:hypothetical protein
MQTNESVQVPPTSNELAELKAKFDVPIGEATKIKPELTNLNGVTSKPEKLKEILSVIHDLEHQTHVAYELWRDKLIVALGWQNLNLISVGRTLAELEKKHLIVEWRNDKNRKLGFMLDEKGLRLLGLAKFVPSPQMILLADSGEIIKLSPPVEVQMPVAPDIGKLLANNADVFMELASLGEKVKEIRVQQAEQRKKLDELDIELDNLTKNLSQPLREFVLKLA